MAASKRLNGWKAIAGYFGRDRTTVARWARERALPIHNIPGGQQKSVFAFEHELADWQTRNSLTEPMVRDVPPSAAVAEPEGPRPRWQAWLIGGGAAVALSTAALVYSQSLPAFAIWQVSPDASVLADYVAARDAWGRRTPADIRFAIRLYESVIRRAPEFAPARAGLAEAWLIYREYGEVSDAQAYSIAKIAAQKAAALNPALPSAHRALGFVAYWWENDPATAKVEFERALELEETDAQTHFWFANMLADVGEDKAAEAHYERARLLFPGSQSIAVEHACAQWQAGRDQLGLQLMTELKTRYPTDATISNCLAWIYMSSGDISGVAREYAAMAKLRREPNLMRLSSDLSSAVSRDPATAHRVLIADAKREIEQGTRRIRETPAFYASSMGDRPALIELLKQAQVNGERWHSLSVTRRIGKRWRNDPEIVSLLGSVTRT